MIDQCKCVTFHYDRQARNEDPAEAVYLDPGLLTTKTQKKDDIWG
jgi:hypothetical protein